MHVKYLTFTQNVFDCRSLLFREKIRNIPHNKVSAKETARSAAIGMFVALTPTFGIQILIVLMIWNIFRFSDKWKFNLPIALSLTLITNYFTVVPYYFLCYCTGFWICNNFNNLIDYTVFADKWQSAINAGFFQSLYNLIKIVPGVYKSLLFGSLFYAVIISILIYKLIRYRLTKIRGWTE